MMLSPVRNRPASPAVQLSSADGQTVAAHLPFQGVPRRKLRLFQRTHGAQAIPEQVQSRNILANTLADVRPSLAFSALFYAIFHVFDTYKSICKSYVISTPVDE